jgi:superoxide dismutase, Fe-Mn family
MTYETKKFEHLLGLPGFSDALLNNHFTLYQGYVTNSKKLVDRLQELLTEDKSSTPEFAELKRRFGWEFNGMRLHELYFSNLSKNKSELVADSEFADKLAADFGSLEAWEKEFRAIGAMRGIGWVALVYDQTAGALMNIWIGEHDLGHLATTKTLLIMDVFEHAFMLDYGLKRADYINAFFDAIDWNAVSKRF